MSDDTKLKLGARPTLGPKTVDVGKVKQSFSHGRTKTVVVETKRRRVIGAPGSAPMDDAAPAEAEAAPAPVQARVAETPRPAPPHDNLTPQERQVALLRQAEEGRMRALEETRRRDERLAVEAQAARALAAAKSAAVPEPAPIEAATTEAAAPTATPIAQAALAAPVSPAPVPSLEAQPAPVQAEQPAAVPAAANGASAPVTRAPDATAPVATRPAAAQPFVRPPAPVREAAPGFRPVPRPVITRPAPPPTAPVPAPVVAAPATAATGQRPLSPAAPRAGTGPRPAAPVAAAPAAPAAGAGEARGPIFRRPAAMPLRRPEPAPPRPRTADDRRQSGKLSVTKALDDNDSVRVRSLAALRRAREKEKRAFNAGGPAAKQVRDVVVPETITVAELANRMAERAADVVKALFKMGAPSAVTDSIDQDTAELIVTEFGHRVKRVSESDVETGLVGDADVDVDLETRPPVVTIMGHVDHGKTSLLDALRGTDIVKGEAGGITQHIGAYQVTVKGGERITFLDTPGHEAFTEMRMRGANVTDIVVLVVAADDGLMPQTIEAINHTRAAGVPMIVAINKIDKPGADANRVRQALLQYEIVVEELSGDTQDVEVSALKRTGLDELVEKILLQAEVLELRANPNRPAEATVIEAQLDKGRGALATVLVNRGTLKVGDIFVVGAESGKVRALIDDKGRQVKSAGPSMPVEVLGLSGVPDAGDPFSVVENDARAREIADYRQSLITRKRTATAPATLETMFASRASNTMEFPIIVKADVQGSMQAIVTAINKLSTDAIKARVLHSGVGGITESDVTLASASKAPIIGFGVRANAKAREIATRDGVALKYYDIIYDLIDEMKLAMAGKLGTERIEHVVGRANIQAVFAAGKGKAAGLLVTEGVIRKALKARILRDDTIVYNGEIGSLRRFKDEVAEVGSGVECGVTFTNFGEMKPNDVLETYEVENRARTL